MIKHPDRNRLLRERVLYSKFKDEVQSWLKKQGLNGWSHDVQSEKKSNEQEVGVATKAPGLPPSDLHPEEAPLPHGFRDKVFNGLRIVPDTDTIPDTNLLLLHTCAHTFM